MCFLTLSGAISLKFYYLCSNDFNVKKLKNGRNGEKLKTYGFLSVVSHALLTLQRLIFVKILVARMSDFSFVTLDFSCSLFCQDF